MLTLTNKVTIIGISGVTGAGKTTLASSLAQELSATLLSWDDFDDISVSPKDYVYWYHHDQDYNAWDYPQLANVLHSLKTKQSILHPVFKKIIQPTEYIIFDAPLGRLHPQTAPYIDICIHIEVPLDISLCRRLIRDFRGNEKTKEELLSEMEYYLSDSRPLFFDDNLKDKADLIIDGTLPLKKQIAISLLFTKLYCLTSARL